MFLRFLSISTAEESQREQVRVMVRVWISASCCKQVQRVLEVFPDVPRITPEDGDALMREEPAKPRQALPPPADLQHVAGLSRQARNPAQPGAGGLSSVVMETHTNSTELRRPCERLRCCSDVGSGSLSVSNLRCRSRNREAATVHVHLTVTRKCLVLVGALGSASSLQTADGF